MAALLKKIAKPLVTLAADTLGAHQRPGLKPRLWILMYHRVLPANDPRFASEEPGMLVTPETLRLHLQQIKKLFTPVRLQDWVAARHAGQALPKKACAITFDDGWLDNYEYALPLLEEAKVPATVFVVADKVGTDFQFWPNIVAALLLNNQYASLHALPPFTSILAELPPPAGSLDREYVAEFIRRLKQFSDQDIFAALGEANWQKLTGPLKPALMNWQQLQTMQNTGLVDIGSHTCSHKRLTDALSPTELHQEIVESRRIIEHNLQTPASLFCFPNGDYSQDALRLVEQTYSAAVTTRRGITAFSQPLHQLTRIGVHDEISHSSASFGARLSSWL